RIAIVKRDKGFNASAPLHFGEQWAAPAPLSPAPNTTIYSCFLSYGLPATSQAVAGVGSCCLLLLVTGSEHL
ncbi:MAG: hypothetical protein ACLVL2_26645, partial [Bacteroides cellulosilyticus]